MKRGLLIFYDYFTPAYKAGGPIRSLENLVNLLEQDLRFYIITSDQEPDGEKLQIQSDEWVSRSEYVSILYLSSKNRRLVFIWEAIEDLQIDLIYINGIFSMFTTILPLRLAEKMDLPVLIAPRGMLQQGALAIKALKKKAYLFMLKWMYLRRKRLFWHATDEQESKDIVRVIGSDSKVFTKGNIPAFDHLQIPARPGKRGLIRLVTVSLIAPKKNYHFFLSVLKKWDSQKPIIYDIYGPVADQQYLAKLNDEILKLSDNIRVTIHPPLRPDEVKKTLLEYDYFVLPTRGENFGHAIFEAFNVGLPVITSDQTPWKGLKVKQAGWDLPLEESAWISAINEAMNISDEDYSSLQDGARKVAVDYMDQVDLRKEYLEMFEMVSG